MKNLGILIMSLVIANSAFASQIQINKKVLGGAVMRLQSKKTLVISGEENTALTKELGQNKKNMLFLAFVMNKNASTLEKTYVNKVVTSKIIKRYDSLTTTQNKLSQN